jgi:hypothetical protein
MLSRESFMALVDSGTVVRVKLYWFLHEGTSMVFLRVFCRW